MEALETFFAVIVIIFWFVKLVMKSRPEKEESSAPEETETENSVENQDSREESPAVFAYFYTSRGEKRVDHAGSNRLSGRELSEYEIFCEQRRLDALWCAQQFEQETVSRPGPEIAEEPEAITEPEIEEMPTFEPEAAAVTTAGSDEEYQLQQLERWLEAGLIDKKEYKRRKRELR